MNLVVMVMKEYKQFLERLSGTSQLDVRGSLNKFPDFFRMGTFIDSTHMKL